MASQFKVFDDRVYALLERYPGIIAIPPNLDRVFVVPTRPGLDPGSERAAVPR